MLVLECSLLKIGCINRIFSHIRVICRRPRILVNDLFRRRIRTIPKKRLGVFLRPYKIDDNIFAIDDKFASRFLIRTVICGKNPSARQIGRFFCSTAKADSHDNNEKSEHNKPFHNNISFKNISPLAPLKVEKPRIIKHVSHRITTPDAFRPVESKTIENISIHIKVQKNRSFIAVDKVARLLIIQVIDAKVDKIIANGIILVIYPANTLANSRLRNPEHLINLVQEQVAIRFKPIICKALLLIKKDKIILGILGPTSASVVIKTCVNTVIIRIGNLDCLRFGLLVAILVDSSLLNNLGSRSVLKLLIEIFSELLDNPIAISFKAPVERSICCADSNVSLTKNCRGTKNTARRQTCNCQRRAIELNELHGSLGIYDHKISLTVFFRIFTLGDCLICNQIVDHVDGRLSLGNNLAGFSRGLARHNCASNHTNNASHSHDFGAVLLQLETNIVNRSAEFCNSICFVHFYLSSLKYKLVKRQCSRKFEHVAVSYTYGLGSSNIFPAVFIICIFAGNSYEVIHISNTHGPIRFNEFVHTRQNFLCFASGLKNNIIETISSSSACSRRIIKSTGTSTSVIVIVSIRNCRCVCALLALAHFAVQDHVDTIRDNIRNGFFDGWNKHIHQNIRLYFRCVF
nr:MAG TPA_asm: hypothetical protein [Caudoviricetes sp.]